ncbi:hypothetical protein BDAP_002794 [Binucleata daphniae]
MLIFAICLIHSKKPVESVLFFVTPRFSITSPPVEMIKFLITDSFGHKILENAIPRVRCRLKDEKILNDDAFLKTFVVTLDVFFATLFTTMPNFKLSWNQKKDFMLKTSKLFAISYLNMVKKESEHFIYKNLYLDVYIKRNVKLDCKTINFIIHCAILHIFNEVFNTNKTNENKDDYLLPIRNEFERLWIETLVFDYIETYHNMINTDKMRIIVIKSDLDTFYKADKLQKVFNNIADRIEIEELTKGYIMLEPLFYLNTKLSFSLKIATDKLLLISNLIKNENDLKMFDKQKNKLNTKNWRCIIKSDYYSCNLINIYEETVKICDYNEDIFTHKNNIKNHFNSIFDIAKQLFSTKIICTNLIENLLNEYNIDEYDQLHDDEAEYDDKEECNEKKTNKVSKKKKKKGKPVTPQKKTKNKTNVKYNEHLFDYYDKIVTRDEIGESFYNDITTTENVSNDDAKTLSETAKQDDHSCIDLNQYDEKNKKEESKWKKRANRKKAKILENKRKKNTASSEQTKNTKKDEIIQCADKESEKCSANKEDNIIPENSKKKQYTKITNADLKRQEQDVKKQIVHKQNSNKNTVKNITPWNIAQASTIYETENKNKQKDQSEHISIKQDNNEPGNATEDQTKNIVTDEIEQCTHVTKCFRTLLSLVNRYIPKLYKLVLKK